MFINDGRLYPFDAKLTKLNIAEKLKDSYIQIYKFGEYQYCFLFFNTAKCESYNLSSE